MHASITSAVEYILTHTFKHLDYHLTGNERANFSAKG